VIAADRGMCLIQWARQTPDLHILWSCFTFQKKIYFTTYLIKSYSSITWLQVGGLTTWSWS